MLDVHALKAEDLQGLDPNAIAAIAAVAAKMLALIGQQARHIDQQARQLERKITFELARLKAWKFGAKTEAMSAEQRRLFEETMTEDEASSARAAAATASPAARARQGLH
jgi:transposase